MRRFVAKFLNVIMIINILIVVNNVNVSASGDPVSGNAAAIGVKNNTLYYIKNKATGLYLDAANRGGAGSKVVQWGFHGSDNQKWKIVYKGTGTGRYQIVPAYNSNLAVQDSGTVGSSITLQTKSNSIKQNFELRRNSSTSLYSIYVETNNSNSFFYRLYAPDKNMGSEIKVSGVFISDASYGEWILEKVSKGDADFYTQKGGGDIDTTKPNGTFSNTFNSMGYYAYTMVNEPGENAYEWLQDDDVWMYSGHGAPGCACFKNGKPVKATGAKGSCAIDNLDRNSLAGLRMAMFFGCNIGVSTPAGANIVDLLFQKGAQFAFAPLQITGVSCDDNWINSFNTSLAQHKTIGEAIQKADIVSPYSAYHYQRGNSYQKLSY